MKTVFYSDKNRSFFRVYLENGVKLFQLLERILLLWEQGLLHILSKQENWIVVSLLQIVELEPCLKRP